MAAARLGIKYLCSPAPESHVLSALPPCSPAERTRVPEPQPDGASEGPREGTSTASATPGEGGVGETEGSRKEGIKQLSYQERSSEQSSGLPGKANFTGGNIDLIRQ